MANTSAAKKAIRQQERRRIRNLQKKKALMAIRKKISALAAEGKKDEARALIPAVYKAFDKAVKIGTLKKNNAARHKSRLSKLVV